MYRARKSLPDDSYLVGVNFLAASGRSLLDQAGRAIYRAQVWFGGAYPRSPTSWVDILLSREKGKRSRNGRLYTSASSRGIWTQTVVISLGIHEVWILLSKIVFEDGVPLVRENSLTVENIVKHESRS